MLVAGAAVAGAASGRLSDAPHLAAVAIAVLALLRLQDALYALALDVRRSFGGALVGDLRLAAVAVLKLILIEILGLILFVVILAAAYGVASTGAGFHADDPGSWSRAVDARGRLIVEVLAALGGLALTWVALRLAYSAAATVALARVQVLSTWTLTRGAVIAIAASLIGINAPLLLALWSLRQVFGAPLQSDVTAVAVGAIVSGLMLPLNVGLMAYLYDQTSPTGPE